jgi:environmental stress-induced protein Ves
VSLAEITEAAPFSCFEGLDRTAVLARGGPLALVGEARTWALNQPGDLACFAGEAPLRNTQPTLPAQIWNVMVRRGALQAQVRCVDDQPWTSPHGGIHFVWVLNGVWTSDAVGHLGVDEGWWLDAADPTLALRPLTSGARLLHTWISPQPAGTRSPTGT